MKIFRKINIIFVVIIVALSLNIYKNIKGKNLGFWTLEQNKAAISLRKFSNGRELLAGEVITGNFRAKYNNLDTIAFWFNTYNRVNNDRLLFRIKTLSAEDYLYQTQVDTNQLFQDKLYQFEFPLIQDSKGKDFQFELESVNGATGSAIFVSNLHETPAIRYSYNFKLLRAERSNFLLFIIEKIIYYFKDQEILFAVISLLVVIVIRGILFSVKNPYLSFLLLTFGFVYSLFWLKTGDNQTISLTLCLLWTVSSIYYRISSNISALNAITLFFLSLVFHLSGGDLLGENLVIWSLLFIFSSAVIQNQQLHSSPTIGIVLFWRSFFDDFKLTLRFLYNGSLHIIDDGKNSYKLYASFSNPEEKNLLIASIPKERFRSIKRLSSLYPFFVFTIASISVLFLAFSNFNHLRNYLEIYFDFFPRDQLQIFVQRTGIYLLFWNLIAFTILIFTFQRYLKNNQSVWLRHKLFVFLIILYLAGLGSDKIFDMTTVSFRDNALIWAVSPNETIEPWIDIAIKGRNFGEMPFLGSVWIDGVEQRVIKWGEKEIIFRTDPFMTRSGNLTVKVYKNTVSNPIYFTYTGYR